MERILIIEDDLLIAELERDYLEAGGFQADIETDGVSGLALLLRSEYDALILDAMLPGKSGFEICKEARSVFNIPIIMVTARQEDLDKVRGLGNGADDYLVKPFSPTELVVRVRTHLQMYQRLTNEGREKKEIHSGSLSISSEKRCVWIGENEIHLSNKEFELLLFLAENPNMVFSKETLFERVWGLEADGTAATVALHINRLREKLEREDASANWIETVRGSGYRFCMTE